MRRDRFILIAVFCATPAIARAQIFPREPDFPRAWLVLSDGVGRNAGGISNSSGLVQLFLASGTVAVARTEGFEPSALLTQVISPPPHPLHHPTLTIPSPSLP